MSRQTKEQKRKDCGCCQHCGNPHHTTEACDWRPRPSPKLMKTLDKPGEKE